jgi:hypothetical protein
MSEPSLINMIREIAAAVTRQKVSDYQITAAASAAGWGGPVTADLETLEFGERVTLANYMLAEGHSAGMTGDEMSALRSITRSRIAFPDTR